MSRRIEIKKINSKLASSSSKSKKTKKSRKGGKSKKMRSLSISSSANSQKKAEKKPVPVEKPVPVPVEKKPVPTRPPKVQSPKVHDGQNKRRHLTVVGGTDVAPSLRELRHHRNRKTTKPEGVSPVGQKKPIVSSGKKADACNLCAKILEHWVQSDGLRQKTVFSDVTLRASDGDHFYCNSFVMAVWSKTLLSQAKSVKSESGTEEEWMIEMDVFSGEVLYTALRFMYGGSVNDLAPQQLSEIVNMADTYRITDLKRACFLAADVMPLKVEGAVALWEFAEEYKLDKAINRAMRFVYSKLEKMVVSVDWSRVSRRVDLLVKLIEASAAWTISSDEWRSLRLEVNTEPNSFTEGVRAIWRNSGELSKPYAFSDKVIVAKSERQYHVHSQIIHVTAPGFASYLQDESNATDSNLIYMDDFDDDIVLEFLRFIYRQEPSTAFSQLAELVHVLASTYDVTDLVRLCERETAVQQIKSIDGAMEMLKEAEEHRMNVAKAACFRYLYANFSEVSKREDWRTLIHDEPQLLTEMLLESKRFRCEVKE